MGYRIFYSYQSDIKKGLNQIFIRDAINEAISKIADYEIEPLIEGFYGVSGNPPLLETMLKQSRNSDIFIGDVTFTMSKVWHSPIDITADKKSILIEIPLGDLKPAPNPNVLIETGYSWALKKYERTILVMNEAFGISSGLPVDMRNLRWPITYNLTEERFSNPAKNKKEFKQLSNALAIAIRSVIISDAEYQREKWNPIKTYRDWKSKDFYGEYMPTENIKLYTTQLRKALENPENPQRIIGPNNTGKTRLAYELFQNIDETLPVHPDVENVLYYDLKFGNFGNIESKLLDLQVINQRKVLILDNCSNEIHEKIFTDYLFNTKISLLSIGDQSDSNSGNIKLDRQFADQIIEKISSKSGNSKHTEYILSNSNSNIRQALVLLDSILKEDTLLIGEYNQKWDQLLGTELIENKALAILEEISLYTHIGYLNQSQHQSEFIRDILQIEKKEDFDKTIKQLEEKFLIKITGDYIVLEVFIEELAISRLVRLVDENILEYFEKLTKNGLSKPFGNRLIELSNLQSTSEIINILTGDGGLLRKFDFISTDEGARILMSVSEISPEKTIDAILSALTPKSIDELKELKKGRRYLVWTLERLCFRKSTFLEASKILYKLALAENEIISNNASSQFSQLFQVYLSGTEASLDERMKLLKEIQASSTLDENSVILKSIGKGLAVRDWMRMGGADNQAGKILQDYNPTDPKEKNTYWAELIQLLLIIGTEDAYNLIINRFSQQFQFGNRNAILKAIELVLAEKKEIDKTLRQQFANVLTDQKKYNPEDILVLLKLEAEYSTHTIEEQLKIRVVEPPYSSYRAEIGEIVNRTETIARGFAHEIIKYNTEDWLDKIDLLLYGDQRQTFNFGNELGRTIGESNELIDAVIERLSIIPLEKQNNSLLEGYLSGIADQTIIRSVIDRYIDKPEICFHAIRLIKLLEINNVDLEKLKTIILVNPIYSLSLQYLRLNHLSIEDFTSFIEWLKNVEPYGWWLAIEFTHDYLDKNEGKLEELKTVVIALLMKEGILSSESNNQISHYYYKTLVEKLNTLDGLNEDVIKFLTNEILLCTNELNFNNEYVLSEILIILFDNYWELSWSIIGQRMMEKDFFGWYNLNNLLKNYKSYKNDNLLAWMEKNPLEAPQCVVHFVDFETQQEGQEIWSPLILEMLNKFGSNEIFLSELSSVLHSWSTSGSALTLLQGRQNLIEQILNHPIIQVKEFAEAEIKMFDSRINRERTFNQNFNIEYS